MTGPGPANFRRSGQDPRSKAPEACSPPSKKLLSSHNYCNRSVASVRRGLFSGETECQITRRGSGPEVATSTQEELGLPRRHVKVVTAEEVDSSLKRLRIRVSDLNLWPTRTHPGDCFSSHRTGDCSDGLVVVDTSRRYDNASYVAAVGTDSKPLPRKRFWNQLISLTDEGVVLVPTSERQQVDHLCSTHWREWTGSVADTPCYVADIHSHSVATKPTVYCHVSRHELRTGNQRVVAADLRRSNVRWTVGEVSPLSHGRG